jgi:hypothetical protein
MLTQEQLAQHPIKSIHELVVIANDITDDGSAIALLRSNLYNLRDSSQRLLAATVDEMLREKRELRAEIQALKKMIQNMEA